MPARFNRTPQGAGTLWVPLGVGAAIPNLQGWLYN
jgi:hypothetical protein